MGSKPNERTGEVPVAEFAGGDVPAFTQALISGLSEFNERWLQRTLTEKGESNRATSLFPVT